MLAARQLLGARVRDVRKTELLEKFGGAPVRCSARHAMRLENRRDVVFRVELREDRAILRQIAEAESRSLVEREIGDVNAVDEDVAGRRLEHADEHRERDGLAGTIRPE